jgi:hypothetical protein
MIVYDNFETQCTTTTQKSRTMLALCIVNIQSNGKPDQCLIPVQAHVNWHSSISDATVLCNTIIQGVDPASETISSFTFAHGNNSNQAILQAVWQDFIKLCCPEDVAMNFRNAMTAVDSQKRDIYLAKMAYDRKNGNDTLIVPLEIWCLQHPNFTCLLLPANIGLDPTLISQRISSGDSHANKIKCVASMLACEESTDRYIPRAQTSRFDFGSQSINAGNKINMSGACTYSQITALLNYDNRDFLQSLGVADLPHVTSCFVHKNMNLYIFINTFRAGDKNYAVHTIYL